jgi:hypothetical protein
VLAYKEAQNYSMLATVDLEIKHFKKKKHLLFFETLDTLCELFLLNKGYASEDEDIDMMVLLLASGATAPPLASTFK